MEVVDEHRTASEGPVVPPSKSEFQRLPNVPTDITDKSSLSAEDKAKILGGNLARALRL